MTVLDMLRTCKSKNKPVPGVTLLYGIGGELPIPEVLKVVPSVVLRVYYDSGPPIDWNSVTAYADGYRFCQWYFNAFVLPFPDRQDQRIRHQILNEPGVGLHTGDWWRGAMDCARDLGNYKLAVCCFSVGFPPLPTDTAIPYHEFWTLAETHRMLWQVQAQDHWLALHQYDLALGEWTNPWDIMRHKFVYSYFPSGCTPVLVFPEFGQEKGAFLAMSDWIRKLGNANRLLAQDKYVRSAMIWEMYHTASWEGDDYLAQPAALPTFQAFTLVA